MRMRVLSAVLLCCSLAVFGEETTASFAAERSKLLAGSRTKIGAVLTLDAPDAPAGSPAVSVQLSVVIDRSGSMGAAGKMEMVHIAGDELVDKLNSSDQLGLVAYASDVEVVRPLMAVSDAAGVKQLIRQLTPTSSTNLGDGLKEGIVQFKGDRSAGTARRLMLMTDGFANVGETDPAVLAQWAKDAFLKGTRVSTIGVGADYNETLLKQIAHAGGGEYYYVSKKDDLPELFRCELMEGRTVVANDVNATVKARDGARFIEIVGYPATGGDEKARQVKIGDLYAKQKRPLLLSFELTPPGDSGSTWLAVELELAWTNVDKKACSVVLPLNFEITHLESAVAESANPDVRVKVIQTENYRALDTAMDFMRKGDGQKALEVIKQAEERINKDANAASDRSVIEQAGQLAQARRDIEAGRDANELSKHNASQGSFGARVGGGKRLVAQQQRFSGGSKATESIVGCGLAWMVKEQQADGSWENGADQQRSAALATLALLGAGYTEKVGEHKANVRRAVAWLISQQRSDGRIGGEDKLPTEPLALYRVIIEHALATMALTEASGMGRIPETMAAATKAVNWLVAQETFTKIAPGLLDNKDINSDDVAGIGWCVFALKSARIAGLEVPAALFDQAAAFVNSREIQENGKGSGTYGLFARKATLLDTSVAAVCRMYTGTSGAELLPSAIWLLQQPGGMTAGTIDDNFDWHHAYFTNLLCFQCGGNVWKTWNEQLKAALHASTSKGGDDKGVLQACGKFKSRARALSVAVGCLCMEVYYRYAPLYR